MASWTDNPNISYTPYIETNPTDAYLRVGMYKEQQLAAGLQKVQQSVDTLTGLPIMKEEDKKYLQNKLSSLKTGISKNLSGDFSDSRIVNQIAGAAKQIYSDPVIQNSVQGSMAVQKVRADVEQAKKDGKWNAANEYVVEDGINNWLSDKTVGSKASQYFSGYTPYTDKIDIFLKYWKDVDPSHAFEGDMTRINAKGEREINPIIFKGKSASQIQAVWNLVKGDANVQQQLQIDGKYQFRGQQPQDIYKSLGEQTKSSIDANNALILTLQAKAATGDKQAIADVESLKAMNKDAEESFMSYAEALKTNPDAVKSALVSQQTLSSLIGAYTSKVAEKNPLWETSFEISKWEREMKEWDITNQRAQETSEWSKYMDIQKYNLEVEKELKKKKEVAGIPVPTALAPSEAIKNEFTARQDIAKAETVYIQSMRELAYNLAVASPGTPPPYYKDPAKGTWEPNAGPGKPYPTPGHANIVAQKFFEEAATASGAGLLIQTDKKLNDLYAKGQDNYANLQAAKTIVEGTEADFAPQMAELAKYISQETQVSTETANNFAKAYVVKNKLTGWQATEIGLKQQYGNDWEVGMNIGTEQRGYGENIEFVPQVLNSKFIAASKILAKNPTLANIVTAKDAAYQEKQKTPIGFTVTTPAAANDETRTTYASIVGQITNLNRTSGKGDYKDFEAMLFGKPEELKQNVYSRYLNPITQQGELTITGKNGKATIPIPGDQYLKFFPSDNQYSAFREKFQTKINLNRGMYTGTEFVNAYQVYQGPSSPYIVKYHVISTGEGAYKLKWWVATPDDKSPSKINMLVNGEVIGEQNGLSQEMSEEAIVAAIKKLEDKQWVELNLALKAKPKQ